MGNVESTKNDMSFEEAVKRLEQINESLESGKLSLDESIALYKEGIGLAADCKKKLDGAKMQISVLDENGVEREYNDEAAD